jgi:hypothetical protein
VLLPFLLISATYCKEVQKKMTPSGINVMIQDRACDEVKDRLIKECKTHHFSLEWLDKGIFIIGPLTGSPLSGDSFIKIEEQYQMEIKCIDPLSTRISVQIQVKGLTADNQWVEIKNPDKLNAYGNRFLDQLIKP